jgi:predicted DNA-binding transcriptional regulator AlpA
MKNDASLALVKGARPESRKDTLVTLYGPEFGRLILASLNRLIPLFEEERVLDTREIEAKTGISRRTIQRMVDSGEFPAPLLLSDTCTGWLKSDFEAWLRSRPRYVPSGGNRA